MDNATVGFGRSTNDGGELSASDWADFRSAVESLVENCGGEVHFVGEGTGYWLGETERSACVAFHANVRFFWIELRSGLTRLAREYRQDAIALTVGEPELVGLLAPPVRSSALADW